ncbi:hypothetical protein ABZX56_30470 [Streptomyces parvulus]|uniref:hypothetical protein n=1 Tax=Streptomyces TaxID=1883 RepID=UPI0033A98516
MTALRTHRRGRRLARTVRRLLTVATAAASMLLGAAGLATAAPSGAITQAAVSIDSGGLEDLLSDNFIPLGILFAGAVIIFGAKAKNWSAALTQGGIVLLGLGVVGLAASATGVGDALVDLVTNGA